LAVLRTHFFKGLYPRATSNIWPDVPWFRSARASAPVYPIGTSGSQPEDPGGRRAPRAGHPEAGDGRVVRDHRGGGATKDKKFVNKIFKQIKAGTTELFVVDDKLGTPTYTVDFANSMFQVMRTDYFGLYNVVSEGSGSRYDVAAEFLRCLKRDERIKVRVVSSYKSQQNLPAAVNQPTDRLLGRAVSQLRASAPPRPDPLSECATRPGNIGLSSRLTGWSGRWLRRRQLPRLSAPTPVWAPWKPSPLDWRSQRGRTKRECHSPASEMEGNCRAMRGMPVVRCPRG